MHNIRGIRIKIVIFDSKVKHPLLARVQSMARFFDNLTEITCERMGSEFFFLLKLLTLLCDVVQLV